MKERPLTQARLQAMDDAELARAATEVAAELPGFTIVKELNGTFYLAADSCLDEMSPSARARLLIVPRLN
jgi:hypothetical protein